MAKDNDGDRKLDDVPAYLKRNDDDGMVSPWNSGGAAADVVKVDAGGGAAAGGKVDAGGGGAAGGKVDAGGGGAGGDVQDDDGVPAYLKRYDDDGRREWLVSPWNPGGYVGGARVKAGGSDRVKAGAGKVDAGGDVQAGGGFSGSTLDDVDDFLKERLEYYRKSEESEDDRRRRERREKRMSTMAGIADVLGSMHRAYSYQRGVRPMDVGGASAKVRERMERARSERERDSDRIVNYAEKLAALQDKRKSGQYKEALLALRQKETERKLAESNARIERLVQQGKTDEARQELMNAQELYYLAKAEGQDVSNQWMDRLNSAKVGLQGAQSRKAVHDAGRPYDTYGGRNSGMGEYTTETRVERDIRGHEIGRVTTRRRGAVNDGDDDNTPPSRRKGADGGNTPPSRR